MKLSETQRMVLETLVREEKTIRWREAYSYRHIWYYPANSPMKDIAKPTVVALKNKGYIEQQEMNPPQYGVTEYAITEVGREAVKGG